MSKTNKQSNKQRSRGVGLVGSLPSIAQDYGKVMDYFIEKARFVKK